VLATGQLARGQDIHFSDYLRSPLNLNPALAGDFKGNYRLAGIYRWQYGTISVPFNTIGIGVDARVEKRKKTFALGYGLQINYDHTGSSQFSTSGVALPVAIHIPLVMKRLFFSTGILASVCNNSLSSSKLVFGDQFYDGRFNDTYQSTDNIGRTSRTYVDLAAGINLKYVINPIVTASTGFSAFNLLTPSQNFTGDKNSKKKERMCVHPLVILRVAPAIDLVPNAKFQFQGTQQEHQFGCLVFHYFNSSSVSQINYGLWFRSRSNDALILNLGFVTNYINFGFSYDINMSPLKTASNSVGGFEVSVLYIYNKAHYFRKIKSIKCPAFM
jgi:type IX secretion system PorP/SprF family membrane protein